MEQKDFSARRERDFFSVIYVLIILLLLYYQRGYYTRGGGITSGGITPLVLRTDYVTDSAEFNRSAE